MLSSFLLIAKRISYMYTCVFQSLSHVQLFVPHGLQSVRLLYPWNSPGKNTGVGCHSLLQEIFLTQVSNQHLLHWQVGSSLPLSHQGSIDMLPSLQTAINSMSFPDGSGSKECHLQCWRHRRCGFDPGVRKIPCRRKLQPTPVSCLKNPMDRVAQWATAHKVEKIQIRLSD